MISIITPTYNESKNIERLVSEIHKSMKGLNYELIVADDNSPDGTAEKVRSLSKKYPVKVIVRHANKGLAPAVVDGFKVARGNIIAVIDADLSHPPETLPKLIKAMEKSNADIVVASRLVSGGGTEDWPRSRKITSYLATGLAKPVTKIKDPMSGFFLLKKEVIHKAPLKARGYKILLEILVKGKYKKAIEVPFIFKDRSAGQSKLTMKTNLEYLMQLLDLYIYKLKKIFLK